MRNTNNINAVFSHIDSTFIPDSVSRSRIALEVLSDGRAHPKIDLLLALGNDPRSQLQTLIGERYGFWSIQNLGGKKGVYQLDARHFSGNSQDDLYARLESKKRYRERSLSQAFREASRRKMAREQYFQALENWANTHEK